MYILNWPNLIHFFCPGAALRLLLLLLTVRLPRVTNLLRRGFWAAIYSSAMLSGWFVPPGWAREWTSLLASDWQHHYGW